jgi:molecular chaperone DnaK
MYALGIDLGTTYTAAAVWRDGRAEIASLGTRGAAIPSVVLLRQDETFLTGESANRRALTEPGRVAREFKRRLGDTTPILLAGVPYSAEALTARMLRFVVDEVSAREGGLPSSVCVGHPANWGPYKIDLLHQAARMSNVDRPITFTTEPEAAAASYAQAQRIEPGAVVAVYDLGGGTFDAAVLRKTETGFAILGHPEGIERLGGIDFDAAVFNHVAHALGGRLAELDETDPAAIAAVGRLRAECTDAKEALSSDTDVSIPVLLPNLSTEVRLTRTEFEGMVRPALYETIEALRRALRSAGVTADELHSVLLVGGSSRMPIVSQMVGAELGRPVAVDAHPKHAVALGAAWLASGSARSSRELKSAPAKPGPQAEPTAAAAAVAASAAATPPPATPPRPAPVYDEPEVARTTLMPRTKPGPSDRPSGGGQGPGRRMAAIAAAALLTGAVIGGGYALANRGGDDDGGGTTGNQPTGAVVNNPTENETSTEETPTEPALPADEQCTDQIKANKRWVCLTSAAFDGQQLVIEYQANFGGSQPNKHEGFHLHIYGGDGTNPPAEVMGTQAGGNAGDWYIEDENPSVRSVDSQDFREAIGTDAPKVCARIANAQHELVPDTDGRFGTGNCVPIRQS